MKPASKLNAGFAPAFFIRHKASISSNRAMLADAALEGGMTFHGSHHRVIQGIGLGVAEVGAGAEVILNSFTDRPEDHALAADLGKRHGVAARYIAADMSKGHECRALVEKAGGCDILVNNAGIQFVAPIEEFPVEKWNAILAINLTSAFHTTAAALPGMRKRAWAGQHRLPTG
jgi:NAD(P)-dependent dehydrogenase (short-subunit alcohol dehydrogenase family)